MLEREKRTRLDNAVVSFRNMRINLIRKREMRFDNIFNNMIFNAHERGCLFHRILTFAFAMHFFFFYLPMAFGRTIEREKKKIN